MNIESAKAHWRKRPISNIEWEKMKKQTYDLEERLLEYLVRFPRAMLLPGFLKFLR